MRILLIHNSYQQRGGEDAVFENEAELLESRGHIIERVLFANDSIPHDRSFIDSTHLAASALWSKTARQKLAEVIKGFSPHVAHFHNTFPLVSPSGYFACHQAGIPVVQTLHNYRLLCSAGVFYHDGHPCQTCLHRAFTWPGIFRGCYRDSRPLSVVVSGIQLSHRGAAIRHHGVDTFIALCESSKAMFIDAGVPAESIVVKPNFVPLDPGLGDHQGGFALFVGRLSPEKGVRTLLNGWDKLSDVIPLKIVGDGPLSSEVEAAVQRNSSVAWLGSQSRESVFDLMGQASVLIFPSECYETFGLTIVEAFSRGTPVIASNIGSSRDLVNPQLTGVHFEEGNPMHLAQQVRWLVSRPQLLKEMGDRARETFLLRYTSERNYEQLMDIYEAVLERNYLHRN